MPHINWTFRCVHWHQKHATLRRKSKTCWLRMRIMCPGWATCLSADCYFSELSL